MQGETSIHGSRDAFRLAFRRGLIQDGDTWMEMARSRTLTSHTYNEDVARQVVVAIMEQYFPLYVQLYHTLLELQREG